MQVAALRALVTSRLHQVASCFRNGWQCWNGSLTAWSRKQRKKSPCTGCWTSVEHPVPRSGGFLVIPPLSTPLLESSDKNFTIPAFRWDSLVSKLWDLCWENDFQPLISSDWWFLPIWIIQILNHPTATWNQMSEVSGTDWTPLTYT